MDKADPQHRQAGQLLFRRELALPYALAGAVGVVGSGSSGPHAASTRAKPPGRVTSSRSLPHQVASARVPDLGRVL
ncbi:hypothetical protein SSPO_095590 [Streptomyces antimycoticus]|uniref:Uncharacterized protein n=1 Tax=Streptomyces antimycoticus TaxID=68175 RepID=A0A499VBD9_9ACTN|nr:hypothetical protein SSPO_095590 [Streptomyces antimycoticus]